MHKRKGTRKANNGRKQEEVRSVGRGGVFNDKEGGRRLEGRVELGRGRERTRENERDRERTREIERE